MLDKIDITDIVKGHVASLRNFGDKAQTKSRSDLILFFGMPVVVTGIAVWLRFGFSIAVVNSLLTAFSIFAGLLFNLLVMVLTFLQSGRGTRTDRQLALRRELLRQITANLSFAILVSIAIITVIIVALAWVPKGEDYIPMWVPSLFSLVH